MRPKLHCMRGKLSARKTTRVPTAMFEDLDFHLLRVINSFKYSFANDAKSAVSFAGRVPREIIGLA